MAEDVLVVVLLVIGLTLVGAVTVLYRLGRRVRRSLGETTEISRRLAPRLERFEQDHAVRARELARLAAAPDRAPVRDRDRST